MVFEVQRDSNVLRHFVQDSRLLPLSGSAVGLIECTQYIPAVLEREGKQLFIAFKRRGESTYHLGFVASLKLSWGVNPLIEGTLSVHEWTGPTKQVMFDCPSGGLVEVTTPELFLLEDMSRFVDHTTLLHMPFTAEDGNPKLKSGARMVFLNQFFGPTILGNTICETVVNERDGCLQSSMFGPDTCPFPIRHVNIAEQPGMVMAEGRDTVTPLTTGRKTLVLHRKEPTKSARRRIVAAKAAGQHSAARWIKLFGRRKFDDESESVVIVVTDEKNNL